MSANKDMVYSSFGMSIFGVVCGIGFLIFLGLVMSNKIVLKSQYVDVNVLKPALLGSGKMPVQPRRLMTLPPHAQPNNATAEHTSPIHERLNEKPTMKYPRYLYQPEQHESKVFQHQQQSRFHEQQHQKHQSPVDDELVSQPHRVSMQQQPGPEHVQQQHMQQQHMQQQQMLQQQMQQQHQHNGAGSQLPALPRPGGHAAAGDRVPGGARIAGGNQPNGVAGGIIQLPSFNEYDLEFTKL
jgi:hypothetical protein